MFPMSCFSVPVIFLHHAEFLGSAGNVAPVEYAEGIAEEQANPKPLLVSRIRKLACTPRCVARNSGVVNMVLETSSSAFLQGPFIVVEKERNTRISGTSKRIACWQVNIAAQACQSFL